jgi:hypothetical protein
MYRLMPPARHHPKVPGFLPTAASARPGLAVELRGALEVIHAAVANLHLYRERLATDDYAAALSDIENAAEQIFNEAALEDARLPATTRNTKRRSL